MGNAAGIARRNIHSTDISRRLVMLGGDLRNRFGVDIHVKKGSIPSDAQVQLESAFGKMKARVYSQRGHVFIQVGEQSARFPMTYAAALLAEMAKGNMRGVDLNAFIADRAQFYRAMGASDETNGFLPSSSTEPVAPVVVTKPPVEDVDFSSIPRPVPVSRPVDMTEPQAPDELKFRFMDRTLACLKEDGFGIYNELRSLIYQMREKNIDSFIDFKGDALAWVRVNTPDGREFFDVELRATGRNQVRRTHGRRHRYALVIHRDGYEGNIYRGALVPLMWEMNQGHHKKHANFGKFIEDVVNHYYPPTNMKSWNAHWGRTEEYAGPKSGTAKPL